VWLIGEWVSWWVNELVDEWVSLGDWTSG